MKKDMELATKNDKQTETLRKTRKDDYYRQQKERQGFGRISSHQQQTKRQKLGKAIIGNSFSAYECTCKLIDHTFFAHKEEQKQRDTHPHCVPLLCC
jgi:hypothetical protein